MIFQKTPIKDLVIVDLDRIEDERGFFSRCFCKEEFENNDLDSNVIQANISYNKSKGTFVVCTISYPLIKKQNLLDA